MIGYHYTTDKNWKKIRTEGLIPSLLNNEFGARSALIEEGAPKNIKGTFVWKKKMTGMKHIGSILYQVVQKGEPEVVRLKVKFTKRDILRIDGRDVDMVHSGLIGNFKYHKEDYAYIVVNRVPPSNLELMGAFDVRDIIR